MPAKPDEGDARYVVAVAAPVSGGKSTVVKRLAFSLFQGIC
jgi:hypothetical protein